MSPDTSGEVLKSESQLELASICHVLPRSPGRGHDDSRDASGPAVTAVGHRACGTQADQSHGRAKALALARSLAQRRAAIDRITNEIREAAPRLRLVGAFPPRKRTPVAFTPL
jgi:hypothetical protein